MFTIKNRPAWPQYHMRFLESCSWSTELNSANEECLAKCFHFQPDMRWKSNADLSQLASDHKPVSDPGSHFPQSNLVNQGKKKKKYKTRKTDSIIAQGHEKTHLNASNIFTPGLKYCTVQQLVQLGLLFKHPASAFLSQLSCLSGRYSSDAVARKHNPPSRPSPSSRAAEPTGNPVSVY